MSDSEADADPQRRKIRENIAGMSFEELIKLKEKMGAKIYNQTVLGASQVKKAVDQKVVKRSNKNRPREITSKIRPKQIRAILESNTSSADLQSKAPASRDPRFDPSCGTLNKAIFKYNYTFLNELRQKERLALEKEYKECTNPERKNTIKFLIQRIDNQTREEEHLRKIDEKEGNEKREIRQKLKQGEKPVYKKKSVKTVENLVEKYEELKNTNKLQKHIQRRAKKVQVKDRKALEKIKGS
ncbi:ribosomal RNA processing protein 36 homolog [Dendroctonus ponderosae]